MTLDFFQHKILTLVYRNKNIFNLTDEDLETAKNCISKFDSVQYACAPSSIAVTVIYCILKKHNDQTKIKPVSSMFVTNIMIKKRGNYKSLESISQKKLTSFPIRRWKEIIEDLMI